MRSERREQWTPRRIGPPTMTGLIPVKRLGKGYCEGCRSYQKAPAQRGKGWRCVRCAE